MTSPCMFPEPEGCNLSLQRGKSVEFENMGKMATGGIQMKKNKLDLISSLRLERRVNPTSSCWEKAVQSCQWKFKSTAAILE